MEPFILSYPSDEAFKYAFQHDGEEMLFVLQGKIRFKYGEKELVLEVLDSRHLCAIDSPMAAKFEENFAEYVGTKHAIATDTGTAALQDSLAALGVGRGDEAIVPAYTFISSSTSILHNNAIPVFCDILPDTFCLDPEDVKKRITDKTKAIMPVHLFGHPAEMDEIMEIAEERDLMVVEDCAQAHASE